MADLVRPLALDIANAVDAEYGGAEVTDDANLTELDLAIARTVLAGSAIARIREQTLRDAAEAIAHAGMVSGRNTAAAWLNDRAREAAPGADGLVVLSVQAYAALTRHDAAARAAGLREAEQIVMRRHLVETALDIAARAAELEAEAQA